MKELYENYPDENFPDDQVAEEKQVVEVEPDAERMDEFIPVIDLMAITKEELRRFLQNVIPEA